TIDVLARYYNQLQRRTKNRKLKTVRYNFGCARIQGATITSTTTTTTTTTRLAFPHRCSLTD
ncbi:hypothetical protein, partial [uncultured Thiodictyon sp.]|uniref:hypothetical protein n=1 Tax=uncultured Thiodictyon sp. TaxID=1846217 RepID=UPI0025ED7E00